MNIPPIIVPQPSITTRSTVPPSEDSGQDHQPSRPSIIPPVTASLPSGSTVRPTTPPNDTAGHVDNANRVHKTPKKRLGKRPQANLSPHKIHQTRNHKKKKLTDDDLAAMEAQNMLQSGSRRRTKPTWRK